MKKLKKYFFAFIMAFVIVGLTACSSGLGRLETRLNEAGYNVQRYTNHIAVNYRRSVVDEDSTTAKVEISNNFRLADEVALELINLLDRNLGNFEEVETLNYQVFMAASTTGSGDTLKHNTMIIFAFPSEAYLREVLANSTKLQEHYTANTFGEYEDENYINGRFLMYIRRNDYNPGEMINIFQGIKNEDE